ncbi:AmiS/UreI family transporter [Aminobacter carboxidus]|uniref:AmiS/UreI family transporter n=1 Tax=Aminobacter carboxidus TaxID=376165 RepID=A0ABR9GTK2_9HYPH|nr:AmiS/UreI family transporter [Aminobacter carboxidus]MBE1207007.1 AmiS/UreI family transporter [Aminobacter carboxidus]
MLLGFALLYVGAVLFLNGLWLLGKIEDREIVVINVVSGIVTFFASLAWAFGPNADAASIKGAALTILFSTTYFWVAYNRVVKVDGRGLGWFSLFVAITTIPVAVQGLSTAQTSTDFWLASNWVIWGVLWFLYFLLLALQRPILRLTAIVTLLAGIVTGWLPGFLLLDGKL